MMFLLITCYMPFGRNYGKDGETYILNPRPKPALQQVVRTMKVLDATTPEAAAAAAHAAAGTMFAVCLTGATRGIWDLAAPFFEATILKGIGADHVHIFAHVQTPDANEIADMEVRFGRQAHQTSPFKPIDVFFYLFICYCSSLIQIVSQNIESFWLDGKAITKTHDGDYYYYYNYYPCCC